MDMQIINCTIWKNYVKTQGGAALYIPSAQKGSSVSIVNCTITENTASGNRGFGCGLCFWKENGLTYSEAQKRLDKAELGELKDFVEKAMNNIGKYNQIGRASCRERV